MLKYHTYLYLSCNMSLKKKMERSGERYIVLQIPKLPFSRSLEYFSELKFGFIREATVRCLIYFTFLLNKLCLCLFCLTNDALKIAESEKNKNLSICFDAILGERSPDPRITLYTSDNQDRAFALSMKIPHKKMLHFC